MPKVKYVGPADVRELGVDDLSRLDVLWEEALRFPRAVALELPEEVVEALVTSELVAGEFVIDDS